MVFKVKADSEMQARKKSIEIYENEFGLESQQIAQQNIEDTDALELHKFVDGKYNLTFKEWFLNLLLHKSYIKKID